ncbi:MAG: hypothetical protein PHO92_02800, partial [Candidatus Peribacteraceae bacterium]|nr:hypothetical protein [Candidatus Peribacteraceae bacterium]
MNQKNLPVYNLTFSDPDLYGEFTVEEKYKFIPTNPINVRGNPREINATHRVEFSLPEEPTLIWRDGFSPDGQPGRRGQNEQNSEIRGHIEDIIIFLSFLNSSQVALGGEDRESMGDFPVYSRGSLPPFSGSSAEIGLDLHHCIEQLRNREWAEKFRNFFCVLHFANGEKITTSEPKFISHIVIWEQIYSLMHGDSESTGLNQIFAKLLHDFFDSTLEFSRKNPCVYFIIRNQFVHSGLWPISGPRLQYTPDSLKRMNFETSENYLRFFSRLTYALLLRVLGFDLPLVKNRLT